MIPGNSRVLTCPKCHGKKEVLSLLSGNTFHDTHWSDTKCDSQMFPQISPVQKCPHCGNFFYSDKQPFVTADSGSSFDLGNLDFNECLSALEQFNNNYSNSEEEITIRVLTVHAFNDKYHRYDIEDVSKYENVDYDRDFILFKENTLKLIKLIEDNNESSLFIAELFREIKMFDECLIKIEEILVENEFVSNIKDSIIKKASENNHIVFKI